MCDDDPGQAYLKFVGIDLEIVASNNHASPTGALPFLLPAHPLNTRVPIPSNKVQKWAIEQVHCEEEQQLNARFDVYASLLDNRIRTAWVCVPYWGPLEFDLVFLKLIRAYSSYMLCTWTPRTSMPSHEGSMSTPQPATLLSAPR